MQMSPISRILSRFDSRKIRLRLGMVCGLLPILILSIPLTSAALTWNKSPDSPISHEFIKLASGACLISFCSDIYRSGNCWDTWVPYTYSPDGCHRVVRGFLELSNGVVLAGSGHNDPWDPEVNKSSDDGQTWNPASGQPVLPGPEAGGHVSAFLELPGGEVLAAVNKNAGGQYAGAYIFRSEDQGDTWTLLSTTPADGMRTLIRRQDGTLLANSTRPEGMLASLDNGASWEVIYDTSDGGQADGMTVTKTGAVLIGPQSLSTAKVHRSPDGVSSWAHAATLAGYVHVFSLFQASDGKVYAGVWVSGSPVAWVLSSSDDGFTWDDEGRIDGDVSAFFEKPQTPPEDCRIYAATGAGLFYSEIECGPCINQPDGTACDDGLDCTTGQDQCKDGLCAGTLGEVPCGPAPPPDGGCDGLGSPSQIIDSTGDGVHSFGGPYSLAVDDDGNAYVTGHFTDNAFRIKPDGTIEEIIDASGDGAGNTLDYPSGIAADGSGNVFIVGQFTHNAFKREPNGTITEIIDSNGDGLGHQLIHPVAIAVDGAGNAYVLGTHTHNVFKVEPDGTISQIIDSSGDGSGNGCNNPRRVTTDGAGNVYVACANSNNAFKIEPAGTISQIIDSSGDGSGKSCYLPRHVAADGAGNVYVTCTITKNAFKIAPGGAITEIIDSTGDGSGNILNEPRALDADATGHVYVGGEYSDNVFKIDPDGAITEIIDSTGDGTHALSKPTFIAVGEDGNVYVTGWHSNNVFKISQGPPDKDCDGVPDEQDICPGGDDNEDTDGDGVPDFCDACPNDPENDADGDGYCGDVDICPGGDDDVNTDGDSLPDFCDVCPLDPENDADGDGVCESDDNCPSVANSGQADTDGDGEGDACDSDIDGDGVGNEDDNCQYDVNPYQADFDDDGAGDACDSDIDGDGVLDADDACLPTPFGEVVNADGCSIGELCPCVHPNGGDKWKNHGAYVSCVAHTSEDFVAAGLITEAEKDAVVSAAAESACGHKK